MDIGCLSHNVYLNRTFQKQKAYFAVLFYIIDITASTKVIVMYLLLVSCLVHLWVKWGLTQVMVWKYQTVSTVYIYKIY